MYWAIYARERWRCLATRSTVLAVRFGDLVCSGCGRPVNLVLPGVGRRRHADSKY